MKIKKINATKLWILVTSFLIWTAGSLHCDTIILKSGSILKGIIVKEYSDRVILRIPNGEVGIYKNLISRIVYLRPEQNLLEIGNKCAKRGEFDEALVHYREALRINQDFEEAKDAIARVTEAKEGQKEISEERLRQSLGIIIKKESNDIKVVSTVSRSPAFRAGIKPGDIIEKIWDVYLKYKKPEEVIALLTGEKGASVSLTIKRQASPIRRKIRWYQKEFVGIGISISMEERGLTITSVSPGQPADKVGLKPGDCIVAIKGKSIRHVSLSVAIKLMAGAVDSPLDLTITRKVSIVRGGYKKIGAAPSLVLPVVKEMEMAGIGVQMASASEGFKIVNVLYHSPAQISGIDAGDLLVSIDGMITKHISVEKATKLLKGQVGSIVQITIERDVSVIRQKIPGKNFGGIGCMLSKGENGFRINKVLLDGAAEKAGMKKGDIVVRVEDKDITNKTSFSQFVEQICGPVGVKLTFTIRRNLAIKRAKIRVQ